MHDFTWQMPAPMGGTRVVFGAGTARRLGDALDALGIERALILCSERRAPLADALAQATGNNRIAVSPVSASGMPRTAYDLLLADQERTGAEAVVALGGGSPIGLGKAWAAETRRPLVAIVTTYSGSEMAANWYIGDGPDRVGGSTDDALPKVAIYDPDLTLALPPRVSAASGMNAMAHAVETLYGPDTNPVFCTMAEDAVRRLCDSLPRIVADPENVEARHEALYAAWVAAAFRATSGIEHVLAQRVRSRFTLDHAHCHAISVPYAIAFNTEAASDAAARIARALGAGAAGPALYDLNVRLGLETGFGAIGMPEAGIGTIADTISKMAFPNPRALDRDGIRNLVAAAWAGDPIA